MHSGSTDKSPAWKSERLAYSGVLEAVEDVSGDSIAICNEMTSPSQNG